jgi:tellurite resistance protein
MNQHVTQKGSHSETAILTSAVDEVYAASAAAASEIGGGAFFAEATGRREDAERNCFHESTAGMASADLWADKVRAFDAIVTVATLVARSDGWVHPAELPQLHDFLYRHGFQSLLARVDLRDCFERRMRELREPGGFEAALAGLSRCEQRRFSHLFIGAGEEIAASDGRLDPREDDILRRVRVALGHNASPAPRECHIPDERP